MATTETRPPFGPAWVGWESYNAFATSVKSDLRYVRSKASEEFLAEVRASCATRRLVIPQKKIFWRARLGCEYEHYENTHPEITVVYDKERPYKREGMKPIPNWQGEGRASPRGIPSLYLATTRDTALAEVRPWLGATISVAQLQVERDLPVIDCAKHHSTDSIDSIVRVFDDHTKTKEDGIWIAIDRAFATPVSNEDEARDYIPTQIIGELFKSEGYDGIVYKSLLSDDGLNIALFNLDDANVIQCALFKMDSISFGFKETGTVS
jgi:RES domain